MTFVIRREQIARLAEMMYEPIVLALARDLAVDPDTVRQFLRRIRTAYRIESLPDISRIAQIARTHGVDFDQPPENAWMRAMLSDAQVHDVSRRVLRLEREAQRRKQVAEHNEAIDDLLAGRDA
jgi:hypothetical protein